MTTQNHDLSHLSSSPPVQRSFLLRVWKSELEGEWRCRLIEVESGQSLVCQHLDELGVYISAWLSVHAPQDRPGIR